MGSVRKMGSGWQLVYQANGKRHFEIVHVKNESDAIRELKIREGREADPRKPAWARDPLTFDDLAADLENEYKARGRRSADTLKWRTQNLKRYFGGRQAASITASDVREYTAQRLADGASPSTIRAELAKLKAMFNLAIRSERMERKPYFPMPREAHPRTGFFEAEDFERVRAHLPEHLKPIAEFGYYTGWRRSEITSLQWEQLDLEQGTVRLWAGTTKNDAGRLLPLGPELSRILKEQLDKRKPGCPWVFHRKGRRILTFYKAWRDACQDAGVPGKLFHDFRRSAARNFTRAGLTKGEAKALGGWKTDSVFERYNLTDERDLPNAAWKAQALMAENLKRACEKRANGKPFEESTVGHSLAESVG